MNMRLSKKVKLIRISKSLTKKQFATLVSSGLTTITNYEGGHSQPNTRFMLRLCQQFPQYTLWLMTDDVNVGKVKNKALKENKENKYLGGELSRAIFMTLSAKLKLLRGTKGLTQKQASELLKCGYSTYQKYELEIHKPGDEFMGKLCNRFPEYALWLMTDIDDVENIKNQSIKQS